MNTWAHAAADWDILQGGGSSPLYGLYRYVRLQRIWFSAVLVKNRVSILVILVWNRVC